MSYRAVFCIVLFKDIRKLARTIGTGRQWCDSVWVESIILDINWISSELQLLSFMYRDLKEECKKGLSIYRLLVNRFASSLRTGLSVNWGVSYLCCRRHSLQHASSQLHLWNRILIKTPGPLNKRDTWTSQPECPHYGKHEGAKHAQCSALQGQGHKVQLRGQEDTWSNWQWQHMLTHSCMHIIRQFSTCIHSAPVRLESTAAEPHISETSWLHANRKSNASLWSHSSGPHMMVNTFVIAEQRLFT